MKSKQSPLDHQRIQQQVVIQKGSAFGSGFGGCLGIMAAIIVIIGGFFALSTAGCVGCVAAVGTAAKNAQDKEKADRESKLPGGVQPKSISPPVEPINPADPATEPKSSELQKQFEKQQEEAKRKADEKRKAEAERQAEADRQANEKMEGARLEKLREEFCKVRRWYSNDGKFTVDASFVSIDGDKVTLQRKDGSQVTVALERMSIADNEFVESIPKELKAAYEKD